MTLEDWLREYNLITTNFNEFVFEIPNFGKFLILKDKNGVLIDKNLEFVVDDADLRRIKKLSPEYFCFQFGVNWYYSKIIKTIDKNSIEHYSFDMKPLKNIGESIEDIPFVHLGVHSEYELLNGNGDLQDWVEKAKFLNHKSLGICDKNTLAGTLALQANCEKYNIKSILGETISVKVNDLTEEVKLYVEDEEGWRNLLRINKVINVENHEERFITRSELLKFSKGLSIVFTQYSQLSELTDYNEVEKYLNIYSCFSNKYYQVDSVIFKSEDRDKKTLDKLSYYFNNFCDLIKPILINDSYYIDKRHNVIKKVLNSIDKKLYNESEDQYYKTGIESISLLYTLFQQDKVYCGQTADELVGAMLNNTIELSENCNYKIETGHHKLPKYDSGKDNNELFFELIQNGVEAKLTQVEDIDIYFERIEKECELIIKAGFVDYFLILWDFVKWAKENDIMVGTGRGSVGGCLIAFLLDIITIDPIKHDLLFERFMNEARVSGERAKSADALPDIDIDFLSERRDDVKKYISQRFGVENTCSIGAYTTIKLKGAIKDFSRVKGLDFKYVNFVSKKIPFQLDYEWIDLIKYAVNNEIISAFVQKHHDIVEMIQYCLKQPRAVSVHASAVLITPKFNNKGEPMTIFDWMPIRLLNGVYVSEWEGKYIDKAGFLKEDILALNALDKFKMTMRLIKRNHNKTIILEKISLEDEKTYDLFRKGYTEDVFQFGSHGLKQYSKFVKPDNIEELTAMNALYRPGPMKSNAHTDFGLIKFGKKKPEYDYMLKDVTKDTYGLYIYQEQIMKAVHVLGGLSLVESDEIRTTIKKFDKVKLKSFEDKFLAGAIKNGCPEEEAKVIWQKLLAFSGYGFNRSHSAAYSLISYWCQYFKAHYPLEFWTTSLHFAGDDDIPNILLEMGKVSKSISIIPPDINYSKNIFDCNKDKQEIYWSLSRIDGLAQSSVESIVNERAKGLFKSLDDFINRVQKAKVNKAKVISLILSGCFDKLHNIESVKDRALLLIDYISRINEPEILEKYNTELFDKEFYWTILQKELTGFGFIDFEGIIKSKVPSKYFIRYNTPQDFFNIKGNYQECFIVGFIKNIYERSSKNGEFAFIELDNNDFTLEGNVWNETYKSNKDMLSKSKGKMIALNVKVKYDTYNNRNRNVFHTHDLTKIFFL